MSRTPFNGVWAVRFGPDACVFAIAGNLFRSFDDPVNTSSVFVPAPEESRPCAYSGSATIQDGARLHLQTSGNDVMSVDSPGQPTREARRLPDTDPFYTVVAQALYASSAFPSVQLALAALSNAQPWAVAWPPCDPCPCLDQGCPGPSFPTKAGPLPGQQGAAIAATAADALLRQELVCRTTRCPCIDTCPHVNSPTAVCDLVRDAKAQVALTLARAPYGRR